MVRQPELNALLKTILGSSNVYFQPPSNVQMQYPAIVYHRDKDWVKHGNNHIYAYKDRYQVTHIDRSPISDVPWKLRNLRFCRFNTWFAKDGLNHNVYTLYF